MPSAATLCYLLASILPEGRTWPAFQVAAKLSRDTSGQSHAHIDSGRYRGCQLTGQVGQFGLWAHEGRPLAVAAWGAEEGEAPGLRAPSSGEEAWEGAWLQCEQLSPEWQVWVAPLMRTLWDRRSRGARKAIE